MIIRYPGVLKTAATVKDNNTVSLITSMKKAAYNWPNEERAHLGFVEEYAKTR